MDFLPVSRADMTHRGWSELDFLILCGDAYIDHPSFGPAVLGRLLEAEGFRVGLAVQPDLNNPLPLLDMGRPRLAVLVASGVVDSMVNNYTAARKPRSDDRYSPAGLAGRRPDRATIRYCNLVRQHFGDVPLLIGGIEASLRRLAHYDYWDNRVRRSILQDSQADILVYGMGEKPLLEIARLLDRGVPVSNLNRIRGTCVLVREEQLPGGAAKLLAKSPRVELPDQLSRLNPENLDALFPADDEYVLLPDYAAVSASKPAYALAFRMLYLEQDPDGGRTLIQSHGRRYLIQNPPQKPLSVEEMDQIYGLPFTRKPHPQYQSQGGVPAVQEVSMSITSHRGCYGGCHFCAIGLHQGRIIQYRSEDSILREARQIIRDPDFKGYIHDIGGPTANFSRPACLKQEKGQVCRERACLFPRPCPALRADHGPLLSLLEKVRQLEGVRKVFIRSGIRFDTLPLDQEHDFLQTLCRYHISGQLKVAPEHVSRRALRAMGKPPPEVYQAFAARFREINQQLGLKQFLVPYLISGHPGCTLEDAVELAIQIKQGQVVPEQVQDFYPTPGTLSTTMYYTGLDPLTMQPVHVASGEEKVMQRALLQYSRPKNRRWVELALEKAGRSDLIGYGSQALIRPSAPRGKPAGHGRKTGHQTLPHKDKEERKHDHHHPRQGTGSRTQGKTGRKNQPQPGRDRKKAGPGRHSGRR